MHIHVDATLYLSYLDHHTVLQQLPCHSCPDVVELICGALPPSTDGRSCCRPNSQKPCLYARLREGRPFQRQTSLGPITTIKERPRDGPRRTTNATLQRKDIFPVSITSETPLLKGSVFDNFIYTIRIHKPFTIQQKA